MGVRSGGASGRWRPEAKEGVKLVMGRWGDP